MDGRLDFTQLVMCFVCTGFLSAGEPIAETSRGVCVQYGGACLQDAGAAPEISVPPAELPAPAFYSKYINANGYPREYS